ncbi:MAG TPA: type II/IV secretion system protein [Acidimicrobiales bacterium]|nr:type II/IV secretion system protein [Acidimicrobiales bacterium]
MGQPEPGGLVANEAAPEYVDLEHHSVDLAAASILPESVARRYHVVPLGRRFGAPVVAISDPNDLVALDNLRAMIGREFVPVVAKREQIDSYLSRLYPGSPFEPKLGSSPAVAPVPGSLEADEPSANGQTAHAPATELVAEPSSQEPRHPGSPQSDAVEPAASQELPKFEPVFESVGEMPDDEDVRAADLVDETVAEFGETQEVLGTAIDEVGAEPAHQGRADRELAGFPPLARVLVEGGRVSAEAMKEVVAEHERGGQAVARVLTSRNLVTEADLMWGMAQEMGLDFVDLDVHGVDFAAAFRLPEATARHHHLLVIGEHDGLPVVAASNPTDVFAMDDVRTILGRNFVTMVATRSQIATYIDRAYHQGSSASEIASTAAASSDYQGHLDDDLSNIQAVVDDAPIVRYVNLLILQALNERASDIHVEPTADNLRIRYRIDGVLHDMSTAPRSIAAAVTTRLKVMADINIAEHRLPQDGRISLTVGNRPVDLRMATLPTIHGEKVVMRIIDKSNIVLGFEDLGFDEDLLERYRAVYTKPYGTILVTGPTGSGKTTTLYATLSALNSTDKNIITVEDPVELRIKGINQIQLNAKAGLTFASALRSILRADPDILLVGEIRDRDTALISIEAALTGHLVLSTLHTNDSASTPMRLVEMGLEPYLVTSAVNGVLAQRLARRLCVHCREPYVPTEAEIAGAGWAPEEVFSGREEPKLYRAVGCSACSRTGYRGRKALLEFLTVTEEIDRMILDGETVDAIHRVAVEQGMVTLRQSGLRKALEGDTTLEEVLRVVA